MTASDASAAPTRYRLKFLPEAMAEWNALDGSVKAILKKLLLNRLEQPRTPGAELRGDLRDCYKIKLLRQGFRLVYQMEPLALFGWVSFYSLFAAMPPLSMPAPPRGGSADAA